MRYHMDCGLCGEPVFMSRQQLLRHERARTLPLCRRNGCYRYAGHLPCERLGGDEKPGTARKSEVVTATHVAGKVWVPGIGKRGHHGAPLANGRVRQAKERSYDGGGEA